LRLIVLDGADGEFVSRVILESALMMIAFAEATANVIGTSRSVWFAGMT
jgi:hypothetical protein